jgi:DUF1680 family protein
MYETGEVTDTIMANDHTAIALTVRSITGFPLDGKVDYLISPSKTATFALNFRVPGWSQNFIAKIGSTVYKGVPGHFLKVEKTWKTGDKVSISFDMPVQIIPGGTSYPDKIAFKRGPQVLAFDQLLNNGTAPGSLQFTGNTATLIDVKGRLPFDWSWKQAYATELQINHKPKQVILVPFSEAGQKATELEVWIDSPNAVSK